MKIHLSNLNTLIPLQTCVEAWIETPLKNVEYAWYVYLDKKRIDMKWYSKSLKKISIIFDKPGIYQIKGYIKDTHGNKYSMRTQEYKVYEQKQFQTLKLKDLKKEVYSFEELSKVNFDNLVPTRYEIKKDNDTLDFLVKRDRYSSNLTVVASAAFVPEKFKPPVFHRFSWMNEIEGNVIYFSDPTLYKSDIKVGWGQGTPKHNPLITISNIVQLIAEKIRVSNECILYYGSSAGGFMSLVLGSLTKGSSVLVNNPITIVNSSSYFEKFVEKMTKDCIEYEGYDLEKITEEFQSRQDLRLVYKNSNYIPNVYYLQNAACKNDMNKFYSPFMKEVQKYGGFEKSNIISHLYWDDTAQHNPVSKEETLYFIKRVTDMWCH